MVSQNARRKFLKQAAFGAVSLAGGALLSACGSAAAPAGQATAESQPTAGSQPTSPAAGSSANEVVLAIASSDLTNWIKTLVDNFNAANTGSTVRLNVFDGDIVDYLFNPETFPKFIETSKPDLAWYSTVGATFDGLLSANLLAPIDDVYTQEGWDKLLPEATLELAKQADGSRYIINDSLQWSPMIYYRKDAFKKAGIEVPPERYFASLEEFYEVCEKLRAAGYTPLNTGSKDGFIVHPVTALLQRTAKPEQMRDLVTNWRKGTTPQVRYTDEPWIETLRLYSEMNQKKVFAEGFQNSYITEARASFIKGESAMYQDGQWAASKATIYGEAPDLDFDWMIYPQVLPDIKPKYLVYSGTGLMAMREAKNLDAAKRFLAFFMNKAQIETAIGQAKTDVPIPPVHTEVSVEVLRPQSPHTADMLAHLRTLGTANGWGIQEPPDMHERCSELLVEMLSGNISPEQVGEEMEKVAEQHRTAEA